MDAVDDCALVVRLERLEGVAGSGGFGEAGGLDVGEGGVSVDLRLAGAEEVEVGAVDEEDFGHCGSGLVGEMDLVK